MGSPAGTEGFTVVVSNTFSLDMVVFGFFFFFFLSLAFKIEDEAK